MANYIFITYTIVYKQVCQFDPEYSTCKFIMFNKCSSAMPHRPAYRSSTRRGFLGHHFKNWSMLAHSKELLVVTDYTQFLPLIH